MKTKKTKVCIDCGKRKILEQFSKQYYVPIRHTVGDGHRTDCKSCHYKKTRAARLNNTTPEQRKTYMREYMRNYTR